MNQIKAVIFDWGAVLIDNPAPGLVAHCSNTLGVSEEKFLEAQNAHLIDFQKGTLPESEFWNRVCAKLGVQEPTQASLWGEAFRASYKEKTEIFELVRRLKEEGYKVGFLSNTEPSPRIFFSEQGYDKLFDVAVFSCEEGTAKPEPRIYEIALERLHLAPEETVFLDDKPINTEAAQALGMEAIVFESSEQVLRDLEGMLTK